jgi:hypothetical protein
MAFSFETWLEQFKKRMRNWKIRMKKAAVDSAYFFASFTDWLGYTYLQLGLEEDLGPRGRPNKQREK